MVTNCTVKGYDPYNITAYSSDNDRASPVQFVIRVAVEYADYVCWNLKILCYVVNGLLRSLRIKFISSLF